VANSIGKKADLSFSPNIQHKGIGRAINYRKKGLEAAMSPFGGILPAVRAKGGGVEPAKIYGVSWDKGSSPALTRTDAAVGMAANAGVDMGAVVNNFDTAEIYRDISEATDALGNVFVRIPKFYIKKTDSANLKTWQISKKMFAGAYLPWCFWDFTNSRELLYLDVGKYNASLSGANKLESKSGTYPLINKNIVDYRTYAQANGAGYQQLDLHTIDVLQTLFLVEFATLNSQTIMQGWTGGQYVATHLATVTEAGVNRIVVANANAALYAVGQPIGIGTSQGGNQICYGRNITAIDVYDGSNKAISFDGAAVNIALGNMLYNVGWKSGFSSGIVAKSGSIASNSDAKHPCIYRGIENPWGSVFQWVDGLNINNYQGWICKNPASYASNLFAAPYEQLGYVNPNADGYIKSVGWDAGYPFANIPDVSAGGASNTYYSDYYYKNTGQIVARFGGSWSSGGSAGLFSWSLYSASSDASVVVTGRLLRRPL